MYLPSCQNSTHDSTRLQGGYLWGCLGLVPRPVEVAAVHLGYQGPSKLLSISKAAKAGKVSTHISDN